MNKLKTDLKDRADIELLVRSFYIKVREDEELGPIFNRHVQDWEHHFSILSDFWETNIFNSAKYRANAIEVHQKVDESENYSIEQTHFAIWLRIWIETIDKLFEGTNAQIAKNKARKMSTYFYLRIFQNRLSK